jgi:chromosome segregation ATPase
MGKYIEKSVNFYLLLLIIAVLIGGSVFAVYYQQVYGTTREGYGECQDTLRVCESRLAGAITNLSISEQDIERYDTLYEGQSQTLSTTKNELTETKSTLQNTQNQLDQANNQINLLNLKVIQLNETVGNLTAQKQNLQGLLNTCQADLATCQAG